MYDDWIWKQVNWTAFSWDDHKILPLTRHIHQKVGILLGQSQHNPEKEHLTLDNLIANLVSSSAIEPYRVCRRLNILRDYSDEKTKLYPRN